MASKNRRASMAIMNRVAYSLCAMPSASRSLEEGRFDGAVARFLSRLWGAASARALVRTLPVPDSARVVAVGGATLGGSGKTPLSIACARELARQGARVAFVGHAYRARPGHARVVRPDDSLAEVGDEALLAARALDPVGVQVIVAPSRALAVARAAREADVLVLDGVLQTSPALASLSLLAVDADEPWGHVAAVPPRGDLRAPVGALLAVSDLVVAVGDGSPDARPVSRGAHLGGALLSWEALRCLRVGLACAIARPDRLRRFLARRGILPVASAFVRDHAAIPARALSAHRSRVDVWLATPKCALHVDSTRVPLATLEHDLVCSGALCVRLSAARLDPRRAGQ
jgi:tetraacyldisaccharide 4'-kinase